MKIPLRASILPRGKPSPRPLLMSKWTASPLQKNFPELRYLPSEILLEPVNRAPERLFIIPESPTTNETAMTSKRSILLLPLASKWLLSAIAIATIATTATSTFAATVQISLSGNMISSSGGNALNADLTGDGMNDITVGSPNASSSDASASIDSGYVYATLLAGLFYEVNANFAGGSGGSAAGGSPASISHMNPITLTDSRINGGMTTEAWVEVNAVNVSAFEHRVALTRLIFDTASTTRPALSSISGPQTAWDPAAVPEPGTAALGALAGLTLLRRRRR
jgi:hypothetical protein